MATVPETLSMSPRSVTVRVPATSANLGTGFDAVGIALQLYADITIRVDGESPRRRPDPMRRMVAAACRDAYRQAEQRAPRGLEIDVETEIPVGRGLGASAAARAAGIMGANALMGGRLDDDAILRLGTELEGHADNIAPALYGGLQVVAVEEDGRITRVATPLHTGLRCVGFIPDFSMPTHETRALLPKRLSRVDAIHNSSRAAVLVAALCTGRWDALRTATDDRVHQHARSKLFPRLFDFFQAAEEADAYAAYLSGGGSTVIAFADSQIAAAVQTAFETAAAAYAIAGTSFLTDPADEGTRIIAGSSDDGL